MPHKHLLNQLSSEWFPVVYEWHDDAWKTYDRHCHQDKVTIYVTQWMVTFMFDDKTTKTISQWQRFDVPPKIFHTAIVWPTWCDYIVGQMTEDDA